MFNEKHWKEISKRFPNKNSLQCFSRFKRIKPGLMRGPWKHTEDSYILELVSKYGKAWSKISSILGTRNGKQIRDRFTNVLDPEIKKGKFTDEEDTQIFNLYVKYGSKWSTIAQHFPKRTADMIKNRFHSSIKKRISNSDQKTPNLKIENSEDCLSQELNISDSTNNISNENVLDNKYDYFYYLIKRKSINV